MKIYTMLGHEEDPVTAKRMLKAINNASIAATGQKLLFESPHEAREYYSSRGLPVDKARTVELTIQSTEDEILQ